MGRHWCVPLLPLVPAEGKSHRGGTVASWMLGSPPLPASPGKMCSRPKCQGNLEGCQGGAHPPQQMPPRVGSSCRYSQGWSDPWAWPSCRQGRAMDSGARGAPGVVGKTPTLRSVLLDPGRDLSHLEQRPNLPHLVAGDSPFPDAEPGSSCQSSRALMPGAGAVALCCVPRQRRACGAPS